MSFEESYYFGQLACDACYGDVVIFRLDEGCSAFQHEATPVDELLVDDILGFLV